jgi:hypothetical protein
MSNHEQENLLQGKANGFDRRAFVKGVGLTGLGLAGAAVMAGSLGAHTQDVQAATMSGLSDADILNFALNLEYLEAEFYTMAVYGKTLAEIGVGINGTGKAGPTTGGQRVTFETSGTQKEFSGKLYLIAQQIQKDEMEHVLFLRSALGGSAVAKPAINLDALGEGFGNFTQFLQLSRAFEDTGVSAYGGAAPLISSKAYLGAAVRIGLTEAYHASAARLLVAENNVHAIMLDSQDIVPPPSGTEYFPNDNNGLSTVRTPSEVLAIVYHNSAPGTYKGGFFPDGVNGNITTV